MWPFSDKSRMLKLPPKDQQLWNVSLTEYEGAALVVRSNQTAREWAGHPDLPVKLGFTIPLNQPNERGMPSAEENEELAAIEDLIARQVSSLTLSVHALTLTTGVMKELIFYIAPGADIAKLHEAIQAQVSSHDVQCLAVEERKWESFRAFAV